MEEKRIIKTSHAFGRDKREDLASLRHENSETKLRERSGKIILGPNYRFEDDVPRDPFDP
jgi:hypothetical protein